MDFRKNLCLLLSLTLCVSSASHGRYTNKTHKRIEVIGPCPFNICSTEDINNYPEEQIEYLVQTQLHYRLKGNVFATLREPLSIGDRGGLPDPYLSFCEAKEVQVFPRYMTDLSRQYRTVFNVPNFTQGITYHVCRTSTSAKPPANECSKLASRDNSYTTRCQQDFSILKLAVLNKAETNVEFVDFQIPTTCSCKYSMIEG